MRTCAGFLPGSSSAHWVVGSHKPRSLVSANLRQVNRYSNKPRAFVQYPHACSGIQLEFCRLLCHSWLPQFFAFRQFALASVCQLLRGDVGQLLGVASRECQCSRRSTSGFLYLSSTQEVAASQLWPNFKRIPSSLLLLHFVSVQSAENCVNSGASGPSSDSFQQNFCRYFFEPPVTCSCVCLNQIQPSPLMPTGSLPLGSDS